VRTALTNAGSIALLRLTSEALVAEIPQEKKAAAGPLFLQSALPPGPLFLQVRSSSKTPAGNTDRVSGGVLRVGECKTIRAVDDAEG
jgi:hypothetical protein